MVALPSVSDHDVGRDRRSIDIDLDPRCLARSVVGEEQMSPMAIEGQRLHRRNLDRDRIGVGDLSGCFALFGASLLLASLVFGAL